MGTEISRDCFADSDFIAFRLRLEEETGLLARWLAEGRFDDRPAEGGYELEAWLIDEQGRPAPRNAELIPLVPASAAVPELARFNIELNGQARCLRGDALSRMHQEIQDHWRDISRAAEPLALRLLMIGTHPTARRQAFCLANMSPLQRYRALNQQIFRQRQDRPVQLDIRGAQRLRHRHRDVMLEASTTSFQIHLRTAPAQAARLYNLSKILSAPLVALSANAPFLFGRNLWAESRIPIFEQSIDVGQSDLTKRVSFGIRYVERSILEVFQANLDRYPILLPELLAQPVERLAHLRLHNGTIWRWNRPLIGFDDDGRPHLRIEQRCAPAGPTSSDCIANAAFYFGCASQLLPAEPPLEAGLPFADARRNFYACARHGLTAQVRWAGGVALPVRTLILDRLLPLAQHGLDRLGIDPAEGAHWLGILHQRVTSGQNGASWQRQWASRHDNDLNAMLARYHELQQGDQPVHLWPLD
jgi:gamma-glutamyl:cysteine ligase YbdK (ATP-grasp superfamily)